MAKTIKYSRTQINGAAPTQLPTEHSTVVSHPVPQYPTQTGLEGLADSFARFFGQVNAGISSVQEGVLIGEKAKIARENDAQKASAVADAYAGREMDPALTNDYDYYDAYRGVTAVKTADAAAGSFDKWYREEFARANPTGDLNAARDQWIKDNLAGSDDKEFEGMVLSNFVKATDKIVAAQRETAARNTIKQGKDNLTAAIDAEAKNGEITPDRVTYYVDAARKLDPLNPTDAAPTVAAALTVAIQNHPEKANQIVDTLSKPGTGVNGKSFAESFPEAYAKLQADAVTSFSQTNTLTEWNALDALKQRADKFKSMSDEELSQFGADLVTTMNKYGSGSAIQTLRNALGTEMDRRADEGVKVAYIDEMLAGRVSLDVSAMKKDLGLWLQKKYGVDSIMKLPPEEAAAILKRTKGAIPDDYKVQVGAALTDFNNPAAQLKAFQLIDAAQKVNTSEWVDKYLIDDYAAPFFNAVIGAHNITGEPIEAILPKMNEMRRTGSDSITWGQVMRDDQPKAEQRAIEAVSSEIRNQMGQGGFFGFGGTNIEIPPALAKTVSDYALSVAITRGGQGASWQQAVSEAVKRMLPRIEVLPGNGKYAISFNTDSDPTYVGADGQRYPRTPLGFNIVNPATGETVNTLAVYSKELDQLSKTAPSVLPLGGKNDVSLSPFITEARKNGGYAVLQGGQPIAYGVGEKVIIGVPDGQMPGPGPYGFVPKFKNAEVVVPDNPAELEKMFGTIPEGFGFVPFQDAAGKKGWLLTYRANFGDQKGVSLDEREKGFQFPTKTGDGFTNYQEPVKPYVNETGETTVIPQRTKPAVSGTPKADATLEQIVRDYEKSLVDGGFDPKEAKRKAEEYRKTITP